ncbi:MAG: phenylalanine--tRNA ligase subunit beta [Janthinobacterium lividum]
MKIPIEWLREFVNTPLDDDALAAKLTMAGLEVEEITASDDGPVYHTKVTPNRGDWVSVVGSAREAAAALDITLSRQMSPLPDESEDIRRWAGVRVEDPVLCPRYTGKLIRNVVFKPSPPWMQARLTAAGMAPRNVVVDVTNYVMLELGQPLHAFDYATLPEGQIVVRSAAEGEKITTLDGTERSLTPDMLVIADRNQPVAIAGIMGGSETEISETTKHVFLESAHFDPGTVRRTSKTLGLMTEASYRYERFIDPALAPIALERACDLLAELADGEVVLGRIDLYPKPLREQVISLRPSRTNAILGTQLDEAAIAGSLRRLGLAVEASSEPLVVTVPTFRPDLVREIDLIEEVGRMIGYDTLPETLPTTGGRGGGDAPMGRLTAYLRTLLIGLGLSEAMTHSLAPPSAFDDPREEAHRVQIRQALSAELSGLRQSLVPNLLEALARNLRQRQPEVKLFEVGKVFSLGKEAGEYLEPRRAAAVLTGPSIDFFTAKGLVEALGTALHLPRLDFAADERPQMHPGRSAAVSLSGQILGYVAELDPDEAKAHLDIPATAGRIAIIELDADVLLAHADPVLRYTPLPRFPATSRDLAVVVDLATPYGLLENTAWEAVSAALTESITLQSIYTGDRVAEGRKSVALRLTFRASDRTLTDAEVDAQVSAAESLLAEKAGAERR